MTLAIITKAATATDAISAEVDRAVGALHSIQGRTINGFGIYSDPSRCRQAMLRREPPSTPP